MESDETSATPELVKMIQAHEKRSQERYESLMEKVEYGYKGEANKMEMGAGNDKTVINVGEGGGGGGAGAMAAVIAALGNRNQGDMGPALLAALGNRNEGRSDIGAILAALNNGRNDRDGLDSLWPLLLLLGRGRGGLGGGGDDCCNDHDVSPAHAAMLQTMAENLSDIRAQVPTVALASQNAIQEAIAKLALADQQGFSNVKDSVQALLLALAQSIAGVNQNVSTQGCQTREWTTQDGEKTRALLVARFSQEDATKIAEQNARIVALETRCDNDRRHAESNLTITNTNNAIASSNQQQQIRNDDDRHHQLLTALVAIGNSVTTQRNKSDQDIINLGTMLASGVQTPTTTQVNR